MNCAGFQKAAICLWVSRTLTAGSRPDAPIMCCWQNSWKKERGIGVQKSPNCSLLWRMMDLNTTQRKILNAGNLSLTVVCCNHRNLMLSEGKPSTEENNMRVSRKCMYNLSTYSLMAICAHNPNEHVTSIFHFYTLQNSCLTHITSLSHTGIIF